MVTLTDHGLEWMAGSLIGNHEHIDAIAVGSGTGNESTTATSLTNQEYKADVSNDNVDVFETTSTGELEASITITGAQEVPNETDITEIAVFGGNTSGEEQLLVIDEFSAVTVYTGRSEAFIVPIQLNR